ncbi:MAG: Hsp20/alpha crystallin family protein [Desulfuromonadaceae bacterium]
MARFDLFREMDGFTREMDQLFRDIGFGRLLEPAQAPLLGARNYPRINLSEKEDCYVVQALLPGIDPKDLEMTILQGTLTLSGERKATEPEAGSWHRRERNLNQFMRVIEIPEKVDLNRVKADYQDGLLTISLPKAAEVRPKRIEITAK